MCFLHALGHEQFSAVDLDTSLNIQWLVKSPVCLKLSFCCSTLASRIIYVVKTLFVFQTKTDKKV